MSFSKTTLGFTTVAIIAVLLGGGIYLRLRPAPEEEDAAPPSEATTLEVPDASLASFARRAQPVTGARVERDTLWIRITASGGAAAFRRATLAARVAGQVREVAVRENDPVDSEAFLIQIDTTEYALALARANSSLTGARADYEQIVLFDDEIADPEVRAERARVARSRSGLDEATVNVRQAEMELSWTHISAPFAGRVADLRVVPGQFVAQGDELVTIVELDPIKVEAQVLEGEIGLLEEGRRATMTFAAFPGETFAGTVETINPVIDLETRSARVTVLLSNPGGRIKPGMYASVSLDAQHFTERVLVPRSAVLERDRRTMLFVFNEEEGEIGRTEWRYVTTGLENDQVVEIVENPETSMVDPGEIVLVDGHHFLGHDAAVQLAEGDVPEGGGATAAGAAPSSGPGP
jgi:RND family efflux transporter MFP subunit